MSTAAKTVKTFDAMRKRWEQIAKEIEGMAPERELAYFKANAKVIRLNSK